jgi:uncharacterized protein YggE
MRAFIWGGAAMVALASLPAGAQEMPRPPMPPEGTMLEIAAEGHSTHVPDLAVIEAGVTTQAPTAAAALSQNNAQMARVIAALRQSGVAERDVQTSSLSLQPQYRQAKDGQTQEIFGYQASNTVTLRFRDVARAGGILDTLVREGATNLSGPNLTLSQPEAAMDEARTKAVATARARAELYARAAGMHVDRILSISDTGPGAIVYPRVMMRANAEAVPISPGEQDVSVTLTMRFLLK